MGVSQRWILLLLLLLTLSLPGVGCQPEPVRFVTDAQGRALVLHGVGFTNSAKTDPMRMPWVEKADVERLSGWGFNAVRFVLQWDALEPVQGQYDAAYLDRVAERVQWCADAGILVILDMHQDLHSGVFPPGDGAPAWAVRDDGNAYVQRDPWVLGYTEPAVRAALRHFWGDADLQDAYAAAWVQVVSRFKDHPAVLGYDLMNEPMTDLSLLDGFEAGPLHAMYERVAASINVLDPDGWILVEGAILTSGGTTSSLPRVAGDRIVYAPHFYPVAVSLQSPHNGDPTPLVFWFMNRKSERRRLQAPLLVGEFGTWDNVEGQDLLLDQMLSLFDSLGSGWIFWSYDRGDSGRQIIDSAGNERGHLQRLVRTYARRIAGQPRSSTFDPETRVFELVFDETGVAESTEIFVPASRSYPEGFVVEVDDPDGTWSQTWDLDKEVLEVRTDPGTSRHVIRVRPAAS